MLFHHQRRLVTLRAIKILDIPFYAGLVPTWCRLIPRCQPWHSLTFTYRVILLKRGCLVTFVVHPAAVLHTRSYQLSFMATSATDGEDATESDAKGPVSFPILRIGKIYTYTIPSFPVIRVQLRHVKYQMISQGKIRVYDGFMKECPSRSYPMKALITLMHFL